MITPLRAACHPSGSSVLPPLSAGSYSGGVYRQHHSAAVCQKAGDVLACSQPGGAALPPVGGILGIYAGSPIHHGGQECGGRLLEPSSSGARV